MAKILEVISESGSRRATLTERNYEIFYAIVNFKYLELCLGRRSFLKDLYIVRYLYNKLPNLSLLPSQAQQKEVKAYLVLI